jgi:tetratricopeptide (TPR) repeat protein
LENLVKAYKLAQDQAKADKKTEADIEILPPEGTVAQFFANKSNQDKTKEWMRTALNAHARNLKVRLLAANWAFSTGQLTEAEKQSSAALQLDPQSLDGLVLRGMVAMFQKNFRAAEGYFEKAHLLRPNSFAASNDLALALIEQNNDDKRQRALEYAENNARTYGKSNQASEAYSTYGWVLYKMDRIEDADKALRAAISGGTFSADTAYYLARVLAKQRGHDKEAIQLLESALKAPGPFANREDATKMLEELKK